ncbi:MAG: hypothetical protein HY822_24205 [Acidobacteria bacterium]|nr:hypothetical protein [Acidobacteriota bacterium]
MKTSVLVVAATALVLSGCSRAIDSKEAIRQGVLDHLAGKAGLDVKSMQVDITSVSFRQNEADAVVSFRPKGSSDPSTGMQMQYTLEKKGDRWVVKGKRDSGMSPHGGAAPAAPQGSGMPPDHPSMGKGTPSGSGK